MFCPKCGTQVPSDANFCMSCGTDLSQYQQQESSGGGVNTGDVGMMKDSQMESTESQQQASIEQNPNITIQLSDIMRDEIQNGMIERAEDQAHEYERIKDMSVQVAPEIAELLKKAKYALSKEEAEDYYDRILDVDIENDIAWYQKFLLHWPPSISLTSSYEFPHGPWNEIPVSGISADSEDKAAVRREIEKVLASFHSLSIPDSDYDDRKNQVPRPEVPLYFENSVKAAPDRFVPCPNCNGFPIIHVKGCIACPSDGFCEKCEGTGKCSSCKGNYTSKCHHPACCNGLCAYCWVVPGTGLCDDCAGFGYSGIFCETCLGMGEVRKEGESGHDV